MTHAPHPRPGYRVYAVRLDAAGEVESGAALTRPFDRSRVAKLMCLAFALGDGADVPAWATHLVVTTGAGVEVFRRPVLGVTA